MQELLKRLQDRHVFRCAEAVAKKAAVDVVSVATVNPDLPNVLEAMMKLEQANARAKTANKVALETEKEKDAAEKTVEELKRQLQPVWLGGLHTGEAETNAKIVDLFKDALDEIKHCRNEQQRVEFHIALACVMLDRETQGTNNGWITRICDRLALKRGKRSQKNGGRPYASDQTVDIRARFNKDVELLQQPLKVGDRVISNGDLWELTQIGDDLISQDPHVGTECVVMFRVGETTQEHKYSTMFGNTKGSVRLQRPPPSLTPSRRAFRKDIQASWRQSMGASTASYFDLFKRYIMGHVRREVPQSARSDAVFRCSRQGGMEPQKNLP